jgi:hypothetical protein
MNVNQGLMMPNYFLKLEFNIKYFKISAYQYGTSCKALKKPPYKKTNKIC